MGEKYLGQLTAKSAPATGDILVLEDSEDTKKIDYDALANAILNKLTTKTYTVAGGTNTLIAAIDALNSNFIYASSLDDLCTKILAMPTSRTAPLFTTSATTSALINLYFIGKGYVSKVSNTVADILIYAGSNGELYAVRVNPTTKEISTGNVISLPTRAEMDDQKSKFSNYKDITATTSNSGSISLAPLGVGAGSSLTSAYIRAEGATMDYTVLLLRTYSGNWYAKVINWNLTPVENTQVTIRLIGTIIS